MKKNEIEERKEVMAEEKSKEKRRRTIHTLRRRWRIKTTRRKKEKGSEEVNRTKEKNGKDKQKDD